MKHNYSRKKYLNRRELLDALKQQDKFSEDTLSSFSQRALKGMKMYEDSENPESYLNTLDSKIDQQVTAMSKTTEPEQKGSTFLLLRLAAGFALVLAAAFLLWPSDPSAEQLFAANFEHLPSAVANTNLERGTTEAEDWKSKAFLAYEQKNYEQAIPNFETYLANTTDFESQFYFGIALLGEGYAQKAINQLKGVKNNPPSDVYGEYATWYLALAYLQVDEVENAKSLLQLLSENSADYQEQAKKLLNAL